jgi:hypothetical protein
VISPYGIRKGDTVAVSVMSIMVECQYRESRQMCWIKDITSRAAQVVSGSSLLILPLGNPHPDRAVHPLTNIH